MLKISSNLGNKSHGSFIVFLLVIFSLESLIIDGKENQDEKHHNQQGSLLQSVHQGLATGRSSILAMSQKWPSNGSIMTATGNTSQWLAPPPNLKQDLRRLGLEYTAADMSLSALYLHELHHRSVAVGIGDKSASSSRRGYPPPGGNIAITGNLKEIIF